MKRKVIIIIILGIAIVFSGCQMYSTTNKWNKIKLGSINEILMDSITFDNHNLFQMRIIKNYEILRDDITQQAISNIPYKNFEQDTTGNYPPSDKTIVEEVYLYLDNFVHIIDTVAVDTIIISNNVYDYITTAYILTTRNLTDTTETTTIITDTIKNSSGVCKEILTATIRKYWPRTGTAMYFNTYPILNAKKRDYIYRKGNDIFINMCREIQVGFWEREGTTIKLALKKNDDLMYIMKGTWTDDKIGIKSLSHTFTREFTKTLNWFETISIQDCEREMAYIDLNDVLALGKDVDELLFFKVPPNRKMVLAPKETRKHWKEKEDTTEQKEDTTKQKKENKHEFEEQVVKEFRIENINDTWCEYRSWGVKYEIPSRRRNFYIEVENTYKDELRRKDTSLYKFNKEKVHMLFKDGTPKINPDCLK